ncbi:hypothetical protein Tco_0189945 [Tanacetum coccineum]
MCPDLVTPEKKKIERYIRGLSERVKANVTSSKPVSLHDVINMARELVEQAIYAKAKRIKERKKRKWEDHQRNNNTHHRTGGRKLPKLMLLPKLGERFILGTYHYAIDVNYITSTSTQLSAGNAKGYVIKPRTAGDNTFNDTDGEDVIDHIAKVLEITEWIKMPNMEKNELRLHVFSKSLSGDAKTWEYSLIPILARRDIDNPDELGKTKEFTVIRHLIGNDEEFITVGPSKINTIERTPGSMSCIYHELFNRKDRGWEVTRTR